jgi:hypothetical protein
MFNLSFFNCHNINAAILVSAIIAFYSYYINVCFGHQTYWRNNGKLLNAHIPSKKKLQKWKSVKTSPEKTVSFFNVLVSDLLVECIMFLTTAEVLTVSSVSHKFYGLCSETRVWTNMTKKLLNPLKIINTDTFYYHILDSIRRRFKKDLDPKVFLFALLSFVPLHYAKCSKGLVLLIQGELYDLSALESKHPGGEHILREWKGKDASAQFDMAIHSAIAKELASTMIIWSPVRVLGYKQLVPKFFASLCRSKKEKLLEALESVFLSDNNS